MSSEVPASPDASARAILQPALQTWLVAQFLWGLAHLVVAFGQEPSPVVHAVAIALTTFAAGGCIAVQAWRDRHLSPLFARTRRGAVELCLLVGIVGGIALDMLERNLFGAWFPPLLEYELGFPLGVALVSVAVVPAVVEELLFRGVLLARLQAVLGWPMAIVVQAMLFSLMHLHGTFVVPHFLFGCMAGFLRMTARALWPCMLLHLLWNAWCVLYAYQVL
ncbi:MAG: CPBP family intramembrane metalloprotease [Planctomycetes bacterium]|nr:CPBP family intramembrane metalloprotease [Planctomycetota bacterium]